MTTLKEALDQLAEGHELDNEQKELIIKKWQKELGIQHCDDAISRQAVMETICTKHCTTYPYCKSKYGCAEMSDIKDLPPVQPKYDTSEWCKTCSEYDHDKHCCPRYNGVIRNAVEEIKQQKTGHWIDADKLKEKIQKYQSIHDSYCESISKGDAWEGHTTNHYDLSSGKATACDVILGFINELQVESEET